MEIHNYYMLRMSDGYKTFSDADNKMKQIFENLSKILSRSSKGYFSYYFSDSFFIGIMNIPVSDPKDGRDSSFIHMFALKFLEDNSNSNFNYIVRKIFEETYNTKILGKKVSRLYLECCRCSIENYVNIEELLFKYKITNKVIRFYFNKTDINIYNDYDSINYALLNDLDNKNDSISNSRNSVSDKNFFENEKDFNYINSKNRHLKFLLNLISGIVFIIAIILFLFSAFDFFEIRTPIIAACFSLISFQLYLISILISNKER